MRALAAWLMALAVGALFVEMAFRAFDAEWEQQMRRNAALREMR